MTDARVEGGWLKVPYDGPEMVIVEIGLGGRWVPAYLDYDEYGRRIAMIAHEGTVGGVEIRWRPAEPGASQ